MRVAGVCVLPVALAGCHQLFDLEEVAPAPQCPGAQPGPPAVDDDQDQLANDVDNCPLVANADQHDEDGDLLGDACDLCPTAHELRDDDCDGIGDSCDPDSAEPHTRLFLGFGDANALINSTAPTTLVTVVDDVLRIDKDSVGGWGKSTVSLPVPLSGVYETRVTITDIASYAEVQLSFGMENVQYPDVGYYARLLRSTTSRLEVGSFGTGAAPTASTTIAQVVPGTYVLRVRVTDRAAGVEVFGDDGLMAMAEAGTLPSLSVDPGATRFGLYSVGADVDFHYLSRTGRAGQ